jgi:hypothetical protein
LRSDASIGDLTELMIFFSEKTFCRFNYSKCLMAAPLICWRCGASLAALSLPLRRLDVCKACNAELHVCKMCVEYDTSYAKHCKEPTAEEERKKDEANFCDHFTPKVGAYVAKDGVELAKAKSALDDLFRK